jgi:hypothetical protein
MTSVADFDAAADIEGAPGQLRALGCKANLTP